MDINRLEKAVDTKEMIRVGTLVASNSSPRMHYGALPCPTERSSKQLSILKRVHAQRNVGEDIGLDSIVGIMDLCWD
jgi:hypothetical protein